MTPQKIGEEFNCSGNKSLSKQEILNYLKTVKIGWYITTDYGEFNNQSEAIEKLSGTIKESCFNY